MGNVEEEGKSLAAKSGHVSLDISSLGGGIWPSKTNTEQCCIYRVPDRLRRVNPEAYTPQMLLIGPLHHCKKAEAIEFLRENSASEDVDKIKSRFLGYVNMERHKRLYLEEFAKRVGMRNAIEQFKKTIKEDEHRIRESYAESTAWIESPEFTDMILHDSVFILEFLLRGYEKGDSSNKIGDMVMDEPCLQDTVFEDLVLLENQLPYFLLEKMFDPVIKTLIPNLSLRNFILTYFSFQGKIKETTEFLHFTDLFRCVRVETLEVKHINNGIEYMCNADRLDSAGVTFEGVEKSCSLEVKFERGCLKIPCFWLYDNLEVTVRNIMALEQCHYPYAAYVCNYMVFLDFLIDTEQDVELLVKGGIIRNWIGHKGTMVEMVNNLCIGVVEVSSYYHDIAESLNKHYQNKWHHIFATLRRVYFTDLWVGTGTVAAVFLLILTLLQTLTAFR